ncbi:lytic murein transglycosylase B [Carnimonas bestiolae]|uniref:lytic murein transglycosylase B n=1 Tax=Carnimonas bestiolae TaxID=3402172 RepID=UPI003F4A89E0
MLRQLPTMIDDAATSSRVASPIVPLLHRIARRWLLPVALLSAAPLASADAHNYAPDSHPDVAAMIDQLAEHHHLDAEALADVMSHAERSQQVLDAMSRPAEHHLRWDQYRQIFIKPQRVNQGVAFIAEHLDDFERAEREYGVPREIIAAILGVETSYGRNKGNIRVIDALSTLAFDYPPRHEFFRKELEAYLTLTQQQHLDPLAIKGSYAGAFGYSQFIPSSYAAYAVDFNGNGVRDLVDEPSDAIGSVANYFAEHGWVQGVPVALPAQGPERETPNGLPINSIDAPSVSNAELRDNGIQSLVPLARDERVTPVALDYADGHLDWWLGTRNFHVITLYNRSHLYAMVVAELAEQIKEALKH